jgi:hypothetical protein
MKPSRILHTTINLAAQHAFCDTSRNFHCPTDAPIVIICVLVAWAKKGRLLLLLLLLHAAFKNAARRSGSRAAWAKNFICCREREIFWYWCARTRGDEISCCECSRLMNRVLHRVPFSSLAANCYKSLFIHVLTRRFNFHITFVLERADEFHPEQRGFSFDQTIHPFTRRGWKSPSLN